MERLAVGSLAVFAAFAVLVATMAPSAAAGRAEPVTPFNDDFDSTPITANGSYQPIVGDFNCDSIEDILWYGAGRSAPDYLWTVTSEKPFAYTSKPLSISGTYRPQIFFTSPSPCASILWYAPGAAQDYLWHPNAAVAPASDNATTAAVPEGFTSVPTTVGGDYLTTLVVDDSSPIPGLPSVFLYGAGTEPEGLLGPTESGNLELNSLGDIVGGDFESIGGASVENPLDSVVFLDDEGSDQILEAFFVGAAPSAVPVSPLRTLTVQRDAGQRLIGPLLYGALAGTQINYGPGAGADELIKYDLVIDSVVKDGQIRGSYTVGSGIRTIVFHRPGPASDYVWIDNQFFVLGAGEDATPWLG